MTTLGNDSDFIGFNELRREMASTSKKGLRCRARRQLRTHAGVIDASSQGTIISEIETLGRRLVEVQWNNDLCVYVFLHEIEILNNLHQSNGDHHQ